MQGQWITVAMWDLADHGSSPVTIQSVRLPGDAPNMQMSAIILADSSNRC